MASMGIIINAIFFGLKLQIPPGQNAADAVSKTLINLVKNFTGVLQNSFLIAYGTKEILFDRVRDIRNVKKDVIITHAQRVNDYLNKIFLKKDNFVGPFKFNHVHGILYIGAGFVGTVAAMHKLSWVNIGNLALPLEIAGNSLFGLACLAALIHNVKIYRAAAKVPKDAPFYERCGAQMLKKSSILGIISSLNYIIAASLMVIGPLASLALLFGCIAVFTGCLKIVYDFIRFQNAR